MNIAFILPVVAGAAIAFQAVLNSLGMRFLGLGGQIGVSGLVTGVLGFTAGAVFLAKPEVTGRAVIYSVGSGCIGAFVLATIVLSARMEGLGHTLFLHAKPGSVGTISRELYGRSGDVGKKIFPYRH